MAIHLRGASEGKVCLILAELAGDTFGLLFKAKRRWRWVEGTRDDVLASVPDDFFERAVAALADEPPP